MKILVTGAYSFIGSHIAVALDAGTALPPLYRRYMRIWFALGWPAFLSVTGIFALMVFRPAL